VNPSKEVYILDSYALMAYLADESGQERLKDLLSKANENRCVLYLCMINFGEVLYITERRRGLVMAQSVQALIESLPIEILDVTRNLILDAAHIKAHYVISYADAFVVAIAQREAATILTGDPEFKTLEEVVQIEWLD
jgi:predicted nucleic acid-binding protein